MPFLEFAPLPLATLQSFESRYRRPLCEGYGLSEASPVVTSNPPTITAYTGSIGLPYPSTIVALRDDAPRSTAR